MPPHATIPPIPHPPYPYICGRPYTIFLLCAPRLGVSVLVSALSLVLVLFLGALVAAVAAVWVVVVSCDHADGCGELELARTPCA